MKTVFAAFLLVLIVMTFVCWAIHPRPNLQGRTLLTWSTDGNPDRNEQESLFSKLNPKYVVTVIPQSLDGFDVTKNIVQSAAGTGPDLIDAYGQSDTQSYVNSGVAWDITNQLKARGVDLNTALWNAEKPECISKGRCYGLAANAYAQGMFFNKSDFDQAGLTYPGARWTWSQFLNDAEKLTLRDPHGNITRYGCLVSISDWMYMVHIWGGRLYVPGGSECVVDTPQSVAAVQFLQDLVYKYHVSPSFSEAESMASGGASSGGSSEGLFGTNQVAMAEGGRYWYIFLRSYFSHLRAGCAEEPEGKYRVTNGGCRVTIINKLSPHREAALNFILYLDSPQYNAMINHEPDGIAPVPKFNFTPTFLYDPEYPNETYNKVWRVAERYAVQPENSPYINQQEETDIVYNETGLLAANQESVQQALHNIQVNINAVIAKNVAEDPKLRAQYDRDAPLRVPPFAPYIQTPQPGIPSEPGQ